MRGTLALLVASALVAVAHPVRAQDPVKLSPRLYTVVLENEHVRVLDFHAKAGDKEPMHSHPAALVQVLTDVKAKFFTSDGKSVVRENKAGAWVWADATTHAYEYIGPGDGHIMIIEFKGVTKAPVQPGKKP